MDNTKLIEMFKSIIPRVEQMVVAEKKHLEFLENSKKLNKKIESFIEQSRRYLNHYQYRLKEYQEYLKKLESKV